jgi:hypothetical protein
MQSSITWQQVAVFVASLAAVLVAHKFLGDGAAVAALVVTMTTNFLLGRGGSKDGAS